MQDRNINESIYSFSNNEIINISERFYLMIIESNFLHDLKKYSKVFNYLSLFIKLAKSNVLSTEQEKKITTRLNLIKEKYKSKGLKLEVLEDKLKNALKYLKNTNAHIAIICSLIDIENIYQSNKKNNHHEIVKPHLLEIEEKMKKPNFSYRYLDNLLKELEYIKKLITQKNISIQILIDNLTNIKTKFFTFHQ